MRTAKKIELIEKKEPYLIGESWEKLYSKEPPCDLKIDGQTVIELIADLTIDAREFQSSVCDFCGVIGCNPRNMLCARRHGERLLIMPQFVYMNGEEDWEEYDGCDKGYRDCPPHAWYTHGILVLEGEILLKFYQLLHKLLPADIPPATQFELDCFEKWEQLVIEQPAEGFARADYGR